MTSVMARRGRKFLVALASCLFLGAATADGFDPTGKYELVKPPQPTETEGAVEVVDIFWYGCPHCFDFLPVMEDYKGSKADYVEVRRMPAIFRPLWALHARAYYTAELLGVADKVHRPLFEAIHLAKKRLDSREALIAFFKSQGIAQSDFEKTYDSFAVESLVRKSRVMQGRYGVRGTPTVIINGKYRTSASLAGGYDNVVKVIQALAAQERKAH